ncbi:MAG: tRNA dihydrouridine synthase [Pseudobdellovibrionaceae bacterium]
MGLIISTQPSSPSVSSPFVGPLLLAPMEGVMDWILRDLLTELGGVDHCVSEFLRVTSYLHSDSIFYKNCPELKTSSRTRAGTPIFVQLLGGQQEPMALNAQRAIELGALGIDLNFGCPAKTVNRHDGGATLLKSCHRLYDITKTVRQAVPVDHPVTAKMRLGFDKPDTCVENALALHAAGANAITVHCRTKEQGYRPFAQWDWFVKIKQALPKDFPLVVNGDIFSRADFLRCQELTEAKYFMIGRGVLTHPYVFCEIADRTRNHKDQSFKVDLNSSRKLDHISGQGHSLPSLSVLLPQFFSACQVAVNSNLALSRTKQWMKSMSQKNPVIQDIFEQVKIIKIPEDFENELIRLLAKI